MEFVLQGRPSQSYVKKKERKENVYNENEFEDSGENKLAWFYF